MQCDGILYIGDPHSTSRCPARRLDEDFMETCLDKLKQSLDLCEEYNAQPVILGDLFDRPRENNGKKTTEMLEALSRILYKSPFKPWIVPGNHDMYETTVTSDTHLAIMEAAGLVDMLDLIDVKTIYIGEQKISTAAVPYGMGLPENADGLRTDEDTFILIAHHDLSFADPYPGAQKLFDMPNVDHVVNGHIHKYQDSIRTGNTTWHNPGNIVRLRFDEADHQPSVLLFDGNSWQRLFLQYEDKHFIFDMTGKQIEGKQIDDMSSEFAEALKEEVAMEDRSKSDDAGYLRESFNPSLWTKI